MASTCIFFERKTKVRFSDNNLTVAVSNGSHLHILRKENKTKMSSAVKE